jgi:hypothetical protein
MEIYREMEKEGARQKIFIPFLPFLLPGFPVCPQF